MAKKLKPEGEEKPSESGVKPMTDTAFRALTASLVSKKADLQEQTGAFGKDTQTVAEATGMTPQIMTTLVKLKRMEPAKRTAHVTMLIIGLQREGFVDEGTLFDTPRTQAKEAADKKVATEKPKSDAEAGAENAEKVAKGIKQKADDDKEFDDKTSSKPSRRARSFDEPPAPPLN